MGCYNCGRDPYFDRDFFDRDFRDRDFHDRDFRHRQYRDRHDFIRPYPYEHRRGRYYGPEFRRYPGRRNNFIGFPGEFK
jgi:hypothetical protein